MTQRCRTCAHPERAAIDKALVAGETTRDVAGRYGLVRASVQRHQEHHLPAKLKRAQEQRDDQEALDLDAELRLCLGKLRRFIEACEETFEDPNRPGRYDLGPRGSEIVVTYERFDGKRFVTRKATLQSLLDEISDAKKATILGTENRAADTRELYLKAFARIQPTLELLGKITGDVPPDTVILRSSPDWLAVRDAIGRGLAGHPEAQEAVFRELRALDA